MTAPHNTSRPGTGILINNLGTPDAPTATAVRHYLKEFLWDPRVVQIPRIPWWLLLHCLVLPFRPKHVAKNYQKIWTEKGSPLSVISQAQVNAISASLEEIQAGETRVVLGMRYGTPSIESALRQLRDAGTNRLIVLPLYPQYSTTTTASTEEEVNAVLQRLNWSPSLHTIADYHAHAPYIDAVSNSVREHYKTNGTPDRLLMSFHGIPERLTKQGDPYFIQCKKTAHLIADRLGLDDTQWLLAFQSRFGREKWLGPAVSETLKQWGQQGIQDVAVVCPGFSADCLETLEEIALQNREIFLASGGKRYDYIPALNTRPDHIAALIELLLPDPV